MTDDPEASMTYSATGGARVQNIPMDTSCLIQLANQMVVKKSVSQIQSRSTTSLNTVPPVVPTAAVKPTTDD